MKGVAVLSLAVQAGAVNLSILYIPAWIVCLLRHSQNESDRLILVKRSSLEWIRWLKVGDDEAEGSQRVSL